jgi:hypothetical protein
VSTTTNRIPTVPHAVVRQWMEPDHAFVALSSRELHALAHWARIGLEQAAQAEQAMRAEAARQQPDDAIFTADGYAMAADGIAESAAMARKAIGFVAYATVAYLPFDRDDLAEMAQDEED